jgi:hypothetical protein
MRLCWGSCDRSTDLWGDCRAANGDRAVADGGGARGLLDSRAAGDEGGSDGCASG